MAFLSALWSSVVSQMAQARLFSSPHTGVETYIYSLHLRLNYLIATHLPERLVVYSRSRSKTSLPLGAMLSTWSALKKDLLNKQINDPAGDRPGLWLGSPGRVKVSCGVRSKGKNLPAFLFFIESSFSLKTLPARPLQM